MVAIAGASIAAPLAMPPTVKLVPPAGSADAIASLRTVSVVSIASAAACPDASSDPSTAATFGMPASSAAIGNGMPIRPVEQTNTSAVSHPSAAAVISHMRRASARPGSPVAAFALPELNTTAAA